MNYIDVNELVISSQDADNTYIALNEYGDIVRTKIAAGGGEGGYVDLSNYYTKQEINNKGFVTDSDVNDYVGNEIGQLEEIINTKQNQLVSGGNIKTVNGQSLLGSGNIVIGGSSDVIVNADWNAQEGEAGYIENKPFCDIKYEIKNSKIDLSKLITIDSFLNIYLNDISFVVGSSETKINNHHIGYDEAVDFTLEGVDVMGDTYEFVFTGDIYNVSVSELGGLYSPDDGYFLKIKQMSNEYIPDTVIKTTPQTLSNDAKNQVLNNLGLVDIATTDYVDSKIGDINNILETI